MMTNNQLMLATACLFSVAFLSGCVSKTAVTENNIQAPPLMDIADTDTATETTTAADTIEPAPQETTAIIDVKDEIKMVGISDGTEASAPKVTTTADGVVIIPLGTPPEEVAAATAKPVKAPNIPDIAKALANHQNSMWHSRSFTYSIYLGGHLNAEYSQEKNALTIVNVEDEESRLSCNYSTKHGGLASIKDDEVSACHSLANELQSYLNED